MYKFTTILHEVRQELGLKNDEYIVCDTISALSNNNDHKYCILSKVDMSKSLDISRTKVFCIIDKLVELGLVERGGINKLRTTQKRTNAITLCKKKS